MELVADEPTLSVRRPACRRCRRLPAALQAEGVASNVVVPVDDGACALRHALIQEAFRGDLLPGERQSLHRAYAEALEADPSSAEGDWVMASIASHWRAADDATKALHAAWLAAGEATVRLAYAEQLTMLEHALELWPRVQPAHRPKGVERAQVLEAAADAACWAVEPERGHQLVEAGLAELDPAIDIERIAGLLLERAMMRQQGMQPGDLDDLQTALRLAAGPTRTRAAALGQICRALALRGSADALQAPAEELSVLASRLGEEEWKVESKVAAAPARPAPDAAAIERLRRAVHDAQTNKASGRAEMIARVAMADLLDARGEHAAAVDDRVMGLPRIKLTLPSDLREYVVRRVTLGGYVNAGEYMRQLIRSDALAQQDRRLRDGLAAHESGRGDLPDGASRRGTGC